MAFVPSSFKPIVLTKSFTGSGVTCRPCTKSAKVCMEYSLKDYSKYNDDARPVEPLSPSKSSTWWTAYRDSLKEKFSPFRGAKDKETTVGYSEAAILAATTPYFLIQAKINAAAFGKGGDPDNMINTPPLQIADKYMANCITKQYKMNAVPYGVYNVQCTEGVTRGQAEYARNLSLSAEFRLKQRSSAQKFGDFCESRRKAIIAAHGCTYEEKLLDRFPIAARTYVRAGSEAKNTCVRYADSTSVQEKYMAECVDKQMKFRSAVSGVYDVMCCDGNAKDVAEYKRVQALSARFRANQLPATVKEAVKFDSAKYARDYFAHECSYEEALFNKYPAVSASMRPSTARYPKGRIFTGSEKLIFADGNVSVSHARVVIASTVRGDPSWKALLADIKHRVHKEFFANRY